MKNLADMTRDEKSLLLYLETRAVDQGGVVQTKHMNAGDMETAKRWDEEKFIGFGRIMSKDIGPGGTHWCVLSDKAFDLVHEERKARSLRMWEKRTWRKTSEKYNEETNE